MEQQDAFLRLSEFGIQFCKAPAKLSKFKIEMRAEMCNSGNFSTRKTACQRFCMVLAYKVDQVNTEFCKTDMLLAHRNISENLGDMLDISILQKCTNSALSNVFGAANPPVDSMNNKIEAPSDSASFEKMIPDIVNSLTDIFTRSTNLDFRAEVSSLIPTSSRAVMSDHLEKALKRATNKPILNQVQVPPQPSVEIEESFDEWEESQRSMPSTPNFQPLSEELSGQCVNASSSAVFKNLSSQTLKKECTETESSALIYDEDLNIEMLFREDMMMNDCIETGNTPSGNEEHLNMDILFREDIIQAENDLETWKLFARAQENKTDSNFGQDTIFQNAYMNNEPSILSSFQDIGDPLCQLERHPDWDRQEALRNLYGSLDFTEEKSSFNERNGLFDLEFRPQCIEGFDQSLPNEFDFECAGPSVFSNVQDHVRESFEYLSFENSCAENLNLTFLDHSESTEMQKHGSFTRKRSSEFLRSRIGNFVTASDDMPIAQVPYKQLKTQNEVHASAESNLCDRSLTQYEPSNCFSDMHYAGMVTGMTERESLLTLSTVRATTSPEGNCDDDSEWFDEEEIAMWKAEMEN
ncbi:hypothetical protein ElyMa_003023100 [Elysia marginata]|uniref:Uncharacterized protein n=1 Tax=Elysia marginata TaxID=1093978 RepID=A0AAV4IFN1_9GAST|nr:hypothetical protein ElyMa_003023100 [Elysia marginata]